MVAHNLIDKDNVLSISKIKELFNHFFRNRERFKEIFQRRHDCIHNCDRPRTAIQTKNVTNIYITKVIEDIDFLVKRCTAEFRTEFRVYLTVLGFSAVIRNQVGA